MALYAISDLHLPLGVNKPMDIFGAGWENYVQRLRENWINTVKQTDTVVLPGDFSWAMYLKEAREDFNYLDSLPGRKILLRGNHDYWWETVSKMERFNEENGFESIDFLHNSYFSYEDTALCGTRYWMFPPGGEENEKIYQRELMRCELTLKKAADDGFGEFIFFMHYPPITADEKHDEKLFEIFKKYGVRRVVYGHIHGNASKKAFIGEYDSIKFDLVSCDFLSFLPLKLKD